MKKLITYKFIIVILSLFSTVPIHSQSNSYFDNNESWAGTSWWTINQDSFYINQQGDTVINGDTLIKLIKVDDVSVIDTTYYLAKNDTGVLMMYYSNINYSATNDTIIIDYSRTDSVTFWKSHNSFNSEEYQSTSIISIDTVFFNGIPKKIFQINDACGDSDNDFIYEGTFGIMDNPFFEGCFEYMNFMTCYSINDSSYYVTGNDFSFSQLGLCIISNLSIKENNPSLIRVFPNPVMDKLSIETSVTKSSKACLFSIDGSKVIEFEIMKNNTQIDLEDILPGIYFLTILSDGVKESFKIIKL